MEDTDKTPVDQTLPVSSDPDKTPTDFGVTGTFSFLSEIFRLKVMGVVDVSHYLAELSFNPEERDKAYWRLAVACDELLEATKDLKNIVVSMMPSEEIEIDI